MQRIAVDIETSCGVQNCPGYGLSNSSKCEHAVHFKLNKIDIIGVYDGKNYYSYRTVAEFDSKHLDDAQIIFHGGKFDYKTLKAKGSKISPRHVIGDTQLLGACIAQKVDQDWLKEYNERRALLNAELPPKQRHRPGTPLTLKTMAPYYLGVDPFWENPVSHDDPEYNRKDCEYTYALHEKLLGVAEKDGTRGYYENYLVPWQKLLAEAEYEGVLIDEKKLHEMYAQATRDLAKLEEGIHSVVADCFGAYRAALESKAREEAQQKCDEFISKRIKNKDKVDGTKARYQKSLEKKIQGLPTGFNLASSQQMLHILAWAGIDTAVEKRDKETNEWIEKEGTDKYVLKRAKVRDKSEFAAKMLEYRAKETEVDYLKQYINAVVEGRIHCTFNITGTRTGRLSSSGPNLQNVKGSLRLPFIVADPEKYTIYTVDSSQIEPRVIAYLTADPELVRLFRDGRDYHNYSTKVMFPSRCTCEEGEVKKKEPHLRKTGKIGDLSIVYGTGEYTFQTMCLLREEMDLPIEECREIVQSFRSGMKHIMMWKYALEQQYKAGQPVHDKFGFLVQARDRRSVHMTLFNTYVQGMASRMIFHASLMAYRHFCRVGIDAKPLLWVHDEVVWRFPKGREEECRKIVDKYMKGYKLETPHGNVPLDVEGNLASCWQK